MALATTTSTINNPSGSGRAAIRYPDSLGTPPFEKWILFEVKSGRHILRTGMSPVANGADRTIKSVALYLPPEALKSSLAIDWQSEEYGAATGAMVSLAAQAGTEIKNPSTELTSLSGIMSFLGKVAPEAGGAIKAAALEVGQTLFEGRTGIDRETQNRLMGGFGGVTPNPRLDVFFKGVQYREHSFSFTMTPRNIGEANAIDEILNTFQYYMLPSFGEDPQLSVGQGDGVIANAKNLLNDMGSYFTTGGSAFIGYPYEFEISTFTESNGSRHHITTFDRSVLTGITIDHAAGTRVAFVDNNGDNQYYPATTSIQLSFKEVRLQGRNNNKVIWRGAGPRPAKKPDGYEETR